MAYSGKNLKKNFSQIFKKSCTKPNFDMENSKIKLIFPIFFIFIFIFATITQECLKKIGQKIKMSYKMGQILFSQIFMKISLQPNFDVENSNIKLIFAIFFIPSLFLPRKFLIRKFAYTLTILWRVFIHISRKRYLFWNVLQ